MKLAVVFNPVAAAEEAATLRELLAEHAASAHWYETTEDDPGVGQTRRALDEGADLVLACGGDGTVRACASALIGTDAALGVIPAGTGNLLARNLDMPTDVPGALATALAGDRRTIDVGIANEEVFTVMAGAGIDAAIMANTPRAAKQAVGSLAYVATAGREVVQAEPTEGRILIDGEPAYEGPISTVLVGNCGRLQAGVQLMPDARLDDGALDMLLLSADGLAEWLSAAPAAMSGGTVPGKVERGQGTTVSVRFATPMPYEVDGESRNETQHLDIRVASRALTVCIPKERS